jgi:hypothetical protein
MFQIEGQNEYRALLDVARRLPPDDAIALRAADLRSGTAAPPPTPSSSRRLWKPDARRS